MFQLSVIIFVSKAIRDETGMGDHTLNLSLALKTSGSVTEVWHFNT
jgi:hypothetical protein